MKTIRRILSVLLLILIALVVGYLVYTGNRLPSIAEQSMIKAISGGVLYV